jgi:hypothetical protein
MKIQELLAEQTIGTTGSTTGQVGTVSTVSQQPSTKPVNQPNQPAKPDPNSKNLDNLLKQNQINVKSVDDFLRAYDSVQQKQPIKNLPPEQQKAIADYTKATINHPGLPTQMASIMKSIQQTKPQTLGQQPTK